MDYVITFSDVMAGVITLGLGVITFFIKGWFNNLKSSTEEIKKQIKENDDKVNKRIDKLEEETDRDIANIKQELNDIKGDFATTFVLRERHLMSFRWRLTRKILRQASPIFRSSSIHLWKMLSVIKS